MARLEHPSAARPLLLRLGAPLMAFLLVLAWMAPGPGLAQTLTDVPSATGSFGEALVFSTRFRAEQEPLRVELLTWLDGERVRQVRLAEVTTSGDGEYLARLRDAGHVVPNTRLRYGFRIVTPDGTLLGPEAEHLVADERFEWRSLTGPRLTLLWHEGSEDFARKALDIGESAIDEAATLLGVARVPPVTFIVYSDSRAFREALGPGTREQVGGQANTRIDTLFGLITPAQIGSDWVEELVRHELTHLVFDQAVANPYHYPPRWLNEGLAVHLSRGYTSGDRARAEAAAGAGSIIPLEGLAGHFPTASRRFSLAYAISVSAVDFLLSTHGPEGLSRLIEAYAQGSSDDEAFTAATGADLAAFDDAWLATLGAERPEPRGPLPVEPGPLPDSWLGEPPPLLP